MKSKMPKYQKEVKRYNEIIANPNTPKEEVKQALKIRNRVNDFIQEMKNQN